MKFGSPAVTFVYHLGVHCTDDDLLVRSLLQDGVALQDRNVIVPRPRTYRKMVREHMHQYRGEPMPEAEQEALYEAILKGYPAERVILGDQDYLCLPQGVFDKGQLYSKAGMRTMWLRYLFPENPCEFFIAIRNPATYLPAALAQKSMPGYDGFVGDADPHEMRWSGVIERIQNNNPGCPITVWCNEDTPLIWPEILREITDTELSAPFKGDHDILKSILKDEGFRKMEAYLESHPPAHEMQRRRIIAAFAEKFARDDALEEEIDLPGWTPELVDEVTAIYEEDVALIERMAGVTFISA
ncbi:hypothetical protein P1J78_02815 [Psychromarinibacter sp. C21-152]|uniref:Uncharacterized protein n=1 Tax=Psychromarinibacter sediminicola TaxID=3033385 RepID=A0AAE3NRK4_9RHOB|nr:hypothetical protein [Psychromarinibacter sediminicola]MDF0599655.1 hypothetical protein [Psychromarinibacter sediminicola]